MNQLKSLYISLYMSGAVAICLYAGWRIADGGDVIAWLGAMATALPLLIYVGWIFATRSVARTSARLPLLTGIGLAGVAAAGWSLHRGSGDIAALAVALGGSLAFLVYAYWYSSFGRKKSQVLRRGGKLPHFEVTGTDGRMIASENLVGTPTILMFYRGNWCPLCMSQVREIAGLYNELERMKVRVALISPQPHRNTVALARKFGVNFTFLTDRHNAAARALGIALDHGLPFGMQVLGYDGETVLPTVIITGADGAILWVHETDNYRVRPEPETFLQVLRSEAFC